mgnify:CR=1 FL=1
MKKFECKGCELHCELTPKETCLLPKHCPFAEGYEPVWHEVKEEDPKLPKLTIEVFNRPDCPEWANYAAVDRRHNAWFFAEKPQIAVDEWWSESDLEEMIILKFDSSTWQDSLIERPTKALPDWVKVDNIGWHSEIGYFKVIDVDNIEKKVRIQHINSKIKEHFSFNTVCIEAKHARPRPFNDKEMRGLVGKVLETPSVALLVNAYGKISQNIVTPGGNYTAEALRDNGFVVDGKPCYKLEHLNEKGEWVE